MRLALHGAGALRGQRAGAPKNPYQPGSSFAVMATLELRRLHEESVR